MKTLIRFKATLALMAALLCPAALVVTVGCSGGCSIFQGAPVDEGSDAVVVHAERTAGFALDTFDTFLKWEYENRALINNPDVKSAADNIRKNGKQWINDLRSTTKAYKAVRSKENADKLDVALVIVNNALEIARRYLVIKAATAPTQ
jgi:hypothetical protein